MDDTMSIGALTGIIRGMGDGGMMLELTLTGDRVPCVLPGEMLEQARQLAHQRVSVAGRIVRGMSGLPVSMTEVWRITPMPYSAPDSYKGAAGILPWQEGDEPAEAVIRRLRDAEW